MRDPSLTYTIAVLREDQSLDSAKAALERATEAARTGTFTADSPQTTLRFTSLTPGPYGITLDGISILSVPPPPPMPPPRTQ